MTDLTGIVRDLIDRKKEGDFWDFKLKHHDKTGDLIKDVICLANTPRHKGDRYLIFGVSDKFDIVGLQPSEIRQQSDVTDALAKAGFAGNNYPDVYLQDVSLTGKSLQVLIIKDLPEKPYYLQKEYNKNGVRLHPGTIYSRVRDSNTSSDQVASATDIETMWRERFGLDRSPLDRIRTFLLHFDGWTKISETSWYYTDFPEFTVSETDEEVWEVDGGENWVRAAINPRAFVRPMKLSYHQTVLATITCIYYDEFRALAPAATAKFPRDGEERWFFYIDAGPRNTA